MADVSDGQYFLAAVAAWSDCLGGPILPPRERQFIQTVETKTFPSHPGTIIFHYAWNGARRVKDAGPVSNAIKLVYFEEQGHEASDFRKASSRVPIVEIWTVSVDRRGRPTNPRKAVLLSITQYGPSHRFLRHTSAEAGLRSMTRLAPEQSTHS